MGQAPFDLTDPGVAGRPIAARSRRWCFPSAASTAPARRIHLTALLRDGAARAAEALPLTLVIRRPDGVEHAWVATRDEGAGGRVHAFALLSDVMPGTWRVSAHVDPRGPAVGETVFLVEDYVPERLAVDLTPRAPAVAPGASAEIDVSARYLFGAPGANLAISGEVSVSAAEASGVPGLAGYVVGLSDEPVEGAFATLSEDVRTDDAGAARVSVPIPDVVAVRPLAAEVTLRVAEEGGRAVSRSLTLPLLPDAPVIGVRPLETDLAEGDLAGFDVIAARPDGSRLAGEATWSLYKVERRFQWYQTGGRWGFEPVTTTERLASGTATLSPDAPARIEAAVSWGAHRLEVVAADPAVLPTSVSFDVGWSGDRSARSGDPILPYPYDRLSYSRRRRDAPVRALGEHAAVISLGPASETCP